MSRLDYWQAERRARFAAEAEFIAEERAQEPPLPTDAEVDAMLADLEPDIEEFDARERAKEREAA